MMAHQNPPYLAFFTPGKNETKNKVQGYQRETKIIKIVMIMKGMTITIKIILVCIEVFYSKIFIPNKNIFIS